MDEGSRIESLGEERWILVIRRHFSGFDTWSSECEMLDRESKYQAKSIFVIPVCLSLEYGILALGNRASTFSGIF